MSRRKNATWRWLRETSLFLNWCVAFYKYQNVPPCVLCLLLKMHSPPFSTLIGQGLTWLNQWASLPSSFECDSSKGGHQQEIRGREECVGRLCIPLIPPVGSAGFSVTSKRIPFLIRWPSLHDYLLWMPVTSPSAVSSGLGIVTALLLLATD